VTDIADAMILGRLFDKLFTAGVMVVMTSNRRPEDLYQGGLQREQFLSFIKILRNAADIVELQANQDYRRNQPAAERQLAYFSANDPEALDAFIVMCYQQLTNHAVLHTEAVTVLGHELTLTAVHGPVLLSSFAELCAKPLGAADYSAIAQRFETVLLARIPQLGVDNSNEAKRFVTLIDVLYEHKVKLICAASVPAEELYPEGEGLFEFRRTVSRLLEMQSEKYWQQKHTRRH
jgi:cell division protein ZapE